MEIVKLNDRPDLFDEAVDFFWLEWGNPENFRFYYDCMLNSCSTESDLPRFYIALFENKIVGSYALLRNDLISRQDLTPWFACLFIVPEFRGMGLGSVLLQHAVKEANQKGYQNLYLTTHLEGYYEKYGWDYVTTGYIFTGESAKIYRKSTKLDD